MLRRWGNALSFIFRIFRKFLVKLSPAFQASRDRLYVDFTVKNLTQNVNPIKMLDVGGADGRLGRLSYEALTSLGYEAFVVVLDRNFRALCRGKKLHGFPEYVCGDANHLPFKPSLRRCLFIQPLRAFKVALARC
jgi:ubiquinone/menaquinone biosynthesis C-methylase UbiE